jgi:hypothetical protein
VSVDDENDDVRQVASRHNDLFKDLRRLLADPAAYRARARSGSKATTCAGALLAAGVARAGASSPSRLGHAGAEALARAAPEVVCIPTR